jgi:thiosulfate dehydrogenase
MRCSMSPKSKLAHRRRGTTRSVWLLISCLVTAIISLLYAHRPTAAAESPQSPSSTPSVTAPAEDLIALGKRIFHDTPHAAKLYVGSRLACGNCHLKDGTAPYAAPMVGIAAFFPEFSQRVNRKISLQDRVNECFVRSENGRPLPEGGREMAALIAYIESLPPNNAEGSEPAGRGLIKLPALAGSPQRGEAIYTAQCASCHGSDGAGIAPTFPPLWGSASFNDGAGMSHIQNMAAFVVKNMPPTSPGSLSPQQAFDVSSYIHTKPRPKYNHKYDKY